jgi:glutamine synthetase
VTSLTPGRLSYKELIAQIRSGETDTVILAITDMQGRLQGKRLDASFFADDIGEAAIDGCSYLLASDVDMRTVDGFALTSWERGYGDLAFKADFTSIRTVPWHDKTVIIFADVETMTGEPVAPSPRQILQQQVARLAERGWTGLTGTELEFIVFEDTYEEAWRPGYRDLTPVNLYNVDYSLQGTSRIEPLLGRIRRSMRGAGMVVESVKGECNFGQHEVAFKYNTLVDKCDEHGLFKLGRQRDRGPGGLQPHLHGQVRRARGQLLSHPPLAARRGRPPVFAGDGARLLRGLRALPRRSARVLARASRCFLAPNINSYKRFVAGSFAPTALLWGIDNRTCAFRVVGHGSSLRLRVPNPGGDVNQYLAVAALVAAGLRGVDESLPLAPAFTGNAYVADAPRVPTTLAEALELFDQSEVARDAFGDEVVDHYVHAAQIEVDAFNAAITDWERYRGFERL